MRPLELRLTHFGPYRDEAVLNFEALDRLFLVCGPTGAGKTTLFDALTYALYEKTPGTRGGLTDQLASHHAPEGSVPQVSLRFALGDQQWRVTRQLRHRLPKKKGEGWTVQDPQVLLERRTEAGWEALSGKRSELNQRLEELIGLSAEEFAKIVVLPQGDFQRFLEASTGDRERMLQKLFPVEAYDRLVEVLKRRAREAEDVRRRWEDRWQDLSSRLGSGVDRPALEAAWAEATEAARAAAEAESEAAAALVRVQALHADWTALNAKRAEQVRLEARLPTIETDRLALERTRLARPLESPWDRQEVVRTEGRRLRADQDQAREKLLKVEAELQNLVAAAEQADAYEIRLGAVLTQRGQLEQQQTLWNEAEGLRVREQSARREQEAAEKAWQEAQAGKETAEKGLEAPPAGPPWAEALTARDRARLREQRLALEGEATRARLEAEAAAERSADADREEALWAEMVGALQAATLASALAEGAACPVCGSFDHPSPATFPQASAEAPLRWEAAKAIATEQRATKVATLTRSETLKHQLSTLAAVEPGPTAAEAEAHLAALQTWMARQEEVRGRIAMASEREAEAARQREAAARARDQWTTRLQALAESVPEDPRPKLASLAAEEATLRRNLETHRRRWEEAGRERQALTTTIEGLEHRLVEQREDYRERQVSLDAALAGLGWSAEEFLRARRTEAEVARLEAGVAAFDREKHRLDGEIATLAARFPQDAPQPLEPVAAALEQARQRRATRDAETREREFALRNLDQLEEELRELQRQKGPLEEEFQRWTPLAKALDGGNSLNLKLTTWVLVQALEQITASATHRLAAMSGGRYALKVQSRGSDARRDWGLDLAVIDGDTGQERAVGTLSGGEKFMASISLALGLADVIQERSGGLKLEAIFIDEGFGTLDDQSLDRAMAILHDLGKHRSVGLISHVAELKQRISSRVEVVKGKNGSWLRVE